MKKIVLLTALLMSMTGAASAGWFDDVEDALEEHLPNDGLIKDHIGVIGNIGNEVGGLPT